MAEKSELGKFSERERNPKALQEPERLIPVLRPERSESATGLRSKVFLPIKGNRSTLFSLKNMPNLVAKKLRRT